MAPVKKPPRQLDRHFLKEWREHSGLTQEAAAEAIMISRAMLSKIEGGSHMYDQEKLERLARLYQCTPSDLISRDPSEPIEEPEISLFDLGVGEIEKVKAYIEGIRAAKQSPEPPPTARRKAS